MIDLAALKIELQTDPQNLGYAPHVAALTVNEIAPLINAANQSIIVADTYLDKDLFLVSITPALLALASASTELQAKWDRIIAFVRASNYVNLAHPSVAPLLALAVTDGILTQPEVDAIGKRAGSRAEQLFGVGAVVTLDNIADALRG